VAQPDLIIRGNGEMIPGVPAFQDGGEVIPWTPAPTGGLLGLQDPSRSWADYVPSADHPFGDPNLVPTGTPGRFWDTLRGRFVDEREVAPTGAAGPAWRPGEFGLEQEMLRLQQQRFGLDQEIQRRQVEINQAKLELERYTAEQNLDLARQTEARIARMERDRLSLDQLRTQIDAELTQRQQAIDVRGQDITQRGQDINAQINLVNARLRQLESDRQDAIARGDLQLRQEIERRQAVMQQQQNVLTQRQQDIQARRQDIDAQIADNQQQIDVFEQERLQATEQGNLQLARDAEERKRALQRQNAALDQHKQAISAAGLGIEAMGAAAGQMGALATGLGGIEAQRAEMLARTAANPRDWMQYMYATGQGEPFLQRLASGQPLAGQSVTATGGRPMLGPGFGRLVGEITQRRDLPYFEQAAGMAGELAGMARGVPAAPSLAALQRLGRMPGQAAMPTWPTMPSLPSPNVSGVAQIPGLGAPLPPMGAMPAPVQGPGLDWQLPPPIPGAGLGFARGGKVVTDEPIVGMGMFSRRPRFTLGEVTPEFPDGKPELLEITPMQVGGTVKTKEPWWQAGNAATSKVGSSLLPAAPKPTARPAATPQPAAPRAAAAAPTAAAVPKPSPVQITINTGQLAGASPSGQGSPFPAGSPYAPLWPPGMAGEPYDPTVPRPAPQYPPYKPTMPGSIGPTPSTEPVTGPPAAQVPLLPVGILPGLPPLPPASGQIGEHQIAPEVAKALAGNPAAAANALAQAESVGAFGPHMDWLRQLVAFQQAQQPAASPGWREVPAPAAPAGPPPNVDELVRNMARGLPPQSYFGMLPKQRQLMEGVLSSWGYPPEDFWASLERTFPTGIDPSRIFMGSFARGGQIATAPRVSRRLHAT